ncbi:MAG: glycosyltransferase family 39 protein [Patescibacteria group bacterium]|jgi:4-amino-4-deoxy-L-arabinose transferase-like glycosyltransferase|nr:glycosyltransferase family 39 protein [Patescibacteria group bacterium]
MKFFNKIHTKTKKNWADIIVIIIALLFFVFCLVFISNYQVEDYPRFSSPDETANYFFTNSFSQGEGITSFNESGIYSEGWVRPRSMRVDQGFLKPVSFPGIILIFGSISGFFGNQIIPYLSPLFASLGIIIFFYLIKRIFNKRVALLSAALLSVFPVYIYYSVRSMFHNILFIVLALASLYLLSRGINRVKAKKTKIKEFFSNFKNYFNKFLSLPEKNDFKKLIPIFFSGVFLGLALITRTSELLWLLPIFFVVWLFFTKRIGFNKTLLFLAGLFLGLLPGLVSNQFLYGDALSGGYSEMNASISEISETGQSMSVKKIFNLEELGVFYEKVKDNIFYFGLKPRQSLNMFNLYVIKMFPYLFWVAILGFLVFVIRNIKRLKKKHIVYFVTGTLFSVFLVLYYGSWLFNDNPDLSQITIGNSYTRYWLPIYLWLMPMAGYFLYRFSNALFPVKYVAKKWRTIFVNSIQILVVTLFALSSLSFVLFGSSEGLLFSRYSYFYDQKSANVVISETESDAIILTKYHDKLFFPQRKVIVATLPDNDLSFQLEKLIEKYPIYYYHFKLPEKDIRYLNERRLIPYGLNINLVREVDDTFSLYEIIKYVEEETVEKDETNQVEDDLDQTKK